MGARITEIIRKANLLSKDDFNKAVEFSHRDSTSLPLFILKNGMLKEEILMPALASGLNLEVINLDETDIEFSIINSIPKDIAIQFRIIPVNRVGNNIIIATGDPTNLDLIDKISAKLGAKIKVKLASELAIQRALEKYYFNKVEDGRDTKNANALSQEAAENYVVTYIERLLQTAATRKVSDVHIEPFEKSIRVRFRSDGILIEYENKARFDLKDNIIARIKVIAGLDISEKRLPQDGNIKLDIPSIGKLDLRVSTLPTVWGEKIVMRLLDKSNLQLDMTKLGFEQEQLNQFKDSIQKPFGMIIVTGPTGSGKTTTLYSALNELNRISDCVVTAEDPVEYTIPGICQVQVKPDIDFTFARALKAFLRQDPDVIMLGEIRDLETAQIATKAALTGHIVLSTLHTNNAAETIERLRNMGIEPFTIISSLNAVLAQRLIRKICLKCKTECQVSIEEQISLGLPEKYAGKFPIFKGTGCDACNGTGYKGRAAIYEILTMNDAIRKIIAENATANEIKKVAMMTGMQTLRQSAWKKVSKGITTIEELLDASGADFDPIKRKV